MACPRRILLVEDTPELREDLTLELSDAGYEVFGAGDARTALQLLDSSRPDLIICDIQLPDTDGLTLIAMMRMACREVEHLPILVMSAFSDSAMRADAAMLHIEHFITKPVDYAALQRLIARQLGRRSPDED